MQVKGAPAAGLAPLLEEAGLTVVPWQGGDMSSSVLGFFDAIATGELRHRSQPVLDLAVEGAQDKKAGDLFIWDRSGSRNDVSPLVACNVAWWLLGHEPEERRSAYADEDFFGGEEPDFDDIYAGEDDSDDDYLLIV